jgi:hypothetical protein
MCVRIQPFLVYSLVVLAVLIAPAVTPAEP